MYASPITDFQFLVPEDGLFSNIATLTNHTSDVTCLTANHQYVVSGALDRTVRVYRIADFSEVCVLSHHTYHIRSLDFSPCGRYLATCSSDGFAAIFDTETNPPFTRIGQCQHPSRCDLRVVTFGYPQGERIATAGDDGSICVWAFSPHSQPELNLLASFGDVNESIHACRFVPHHDDLLISGSSAGDLRLWRLIDTGNQHQQNLNSPRLSAKCHLYIPTTHDLGVTSMDVVARRDDPTILMASGGHDNIINLWEICPKPPDNPSLRLICSRRDHNQSILSLKFSRHDANMLLLASTSIDPTVVIYSVQHNQQQNRTSNSHEITIVQRVSDHSRYVNCATFSPDTSFLFTGSNDHTIKAYGQNNPNSRRHSTAVMEGLHQKLVVALPPVSSKVDSSARRQMLSQAMSLPNDSKYSHCPPEFTCPITQELMNDPVIASDGYTYERNAISSWFQRGEVTSPMTNAPLSHRNLIPNITLRSMIRRYVEEIDAESNSGGSASGI